jgi:hypothetical protein
MQAAALYGATLPFGKAPASHRPLHRLSPATEDPVHLPLPTVDSEIRPGNAIAGVESAKPGLNRFRSVVQVWKEMEPKEVLRKEFEQIREEISKRREQRSQMKDSVRHESRTLYFSARIVIRQYTEYLCLVVWIKRDGDGDGGVYLCSRMGRRIMGIK